MSVFASGLDATGFEHKIKKSCRDRENSPALVRGGHRSLRSFALAALWKGGVDSAISQIVAPRDQISAFVGL